MISYAWSATHTAVTSVSVSSAGTTTATGKSNAQATAATKRPRPSVRETRNERRAATEADRRDRVELVSDMCKRRLHREREEDDANHHRQMQVGVDIARKSGAVGEQLLCPDREEVEVGQPERGRHHEPEDRGDDHTGAESSRPGPEADGDQGLADRNDHDQPVALDEVRRLHAPTAHATEERPEEADHDRDQPEHGPEPAVDEPRGDDQSRAGEGRGSNPQDRRQQGSTVLVNQA
jgi:hypothetical protein